MILAMRLTIGSVVSVEWCVAKEWLHIVWKDKVLIFLWFRLLHLWERHRGGEERKRRTMRGSITPWDISSTLDIAMFPISKPAYL